MFRRSASVVDRSREVYQPSFFSSPHFTRTTTLFTSHLMRLPSLLPALAHVSRTHATPNAHLTLQSCRRAMSTALPRPYRFHIGASWTGKPVHPRARKSYMTPFSADSEIGLWRDHVLSRPNGGMGPHIGEDFFYVQEVRPASVYLAIVIYQQFIPSG